MVPLRPSSSFSTAAPEPGVEEEKGRDVSGASPTRTEELHVPEQEAHVSKPVHRAHERSAETPPGAVARLPGQNDGAAKDAQETTPQHGCDEAEPRVDEASREAFELEVLQFEQWRSAERKRLARERRVLERQAKALLRVPDRREREEVEKLRSELAAARQELQVREVRWRTSMERLRQQLTDATNLRGELEKEVLYLEQMTAASSSEKQAECSSGHRRCKGRSARPSDTRQSQMTKHAVASIGEEAYSAHSRGDVGRAAVFG